MSMPLLLIALVFAVFATVEWSRLPAIARVYLGVATAFAIGALVHPDMSVAIDPARDGVASLLAAARAAGVAAVMLSVLSALRRAVLR